MKFFSLPGSGSWGFSDASRLCISLDGVDVFCFFSSLYNLYIGSKTPLGLEAFGFRLSFSCFFVLKFVGRLRRTHLGGSLFLIFPPLPSLQDLVSLVFHAQMGFLRVLLALSCTRRRSTLPSTSLSFRWTLCFLIGWVSPLLLSDFVQKRVCLSFFYFFLMWLHRVIVCYFSPVLSFKHHLMIPQGGSTTFLSIFTLFSVTCICCRLLPPLRAYLTPFSKFFLPNFGGSPTHGCPFR